MQSVKHTVAGAVYTSPKKIFKLKCESIEEELRYTTVVKDYGSVAEIEPNYKK